MIHYCFLRTVVSLLRVYPVEGPGTSVELHILPTQLQSSSYEVVCAEEWVELLRWKKRSHTRGVVALLCLYRRRAPIREQPPYSVVTLAIADESGSWHLHLICNRCWHTGGNACQIFQGASGET